MRMINSQASASTGKPASPATMRAKPPRLAWAIISVAWRWQTYLNCLYLLVSFPLGFAYFLILVILLAMGLGLATILVGLAILLLALLLWRALANFERQMTAWWLNVEITPFPEPAAQNVWQRFRARLSARVTWTSLIYLLVKFPFGLATFILLFILLTGITQLLVAPLVYLISLATGGAAPLVGGPLVVALYPFAGLALGLVTLHAANGVAYLWRQFSRIMLGMTRAEAQLVATQQVVIAERARATRADQTRRELIVNVSHELRTPIASIRGHIESLLISAEAANKAAIQSTTATSGDDAQAQEDVADVARPSPQVKPSELQSYLSIVYRETEQLSTLVDDLLTLARAEADELRLDIRPVVVAEVIEEVYRTLEPLARRERQITLIRQAPPGLPPALADRQRLLQVTLNLVRNAITYTPDGGIVSLTLAQSDSAHLALTVADTGIGIAPDELANVFDRFFRVDASRTRATGGSGLGLAIVRDLTEAMGGSISAESIVGQGSQFRVLLRIAQ